MNFHQNKMFPMNKIFDTRKYFYSKLTKQTKSSKHANKIQIFTILKKQFKQNRRITFFVLQKKKKWNAIYSWHAYINYVMNFKIKSNRLIKYSNTI